MYSSDAFYGAILANAFGTTLFIVLIFSNIYRFRTHTKESNYLLKILLVSMGCGILNVCLYLLDGTPGQLVYWILLIGNTFVYATYIINSYWFFSFFQHHLNYRDPQWGVLSKLLCIIAAIFLVLDLNGDLIFMINENNSFVRRPMYVTYFILMISFNVITLVMYFWGRRRKAFKFFPVAVYCIPLIIAELFQLQNVNLTIVIPSVSIALTGILAGLKNEELYKDQLTGIYNRTYLNYIKKTINKQHADQIFGMMIDLNGFKGINDNFGHKVGDEALIQTAKILENVVGESGSAVRYSGDEFILLIKTNDQETAAGVKQKVNRAFEQFNENSGMPYTLSASIGIKKLDLRSQDVDDFIHELDKEMYSDKAEYYSKFENERRSVNVSGSSQ